MADSGISCVSRGFIHPKLPRGPASALVRSPHTQSPQGSPIPMSVIFIDLHAVVLSSQKAPTFRILVQKTDCTYKAFPMAVYKHLTSAD